MALNVNKWSVQKQKTTKVDQQTKTKNQKLTQDGTAIVCGSLKWRSEGKLSLS